MLDFYPLMTNEQFQKVKSLALSKNLKTKYTPLILSHCAIYNLRRNNLSDALNQIERAITINTEINPNHQEAFIDLYIKKAFILTKLRQTENAIISVRKAQKLRKKIFGLERESDP